MKKYVLVMIFTIMFFSILQAVEKESPKMDDRKWGDYWRWCEKMTWQESFQLNHNTTRIIFHQHCSI